MELQVYISLLLLVCHTATTCDITKECPMDKEVTWATDGKLCHVFQNKCFLDEVNCHHKNNKDPQLQEIPQEQCQTLCITDCAQDDNPVCGYYNDKKLTFANQCEMESYICRTGETLFVYGIGPCDP